MSLVFRRAIGAASALALGSLAVAPATAGVISRATSDRLTTYSIVALPSLGGVYANTSSINAYGLAAGVADPAGDAVSHATVWLGGRPFDLGALGGAGVNSSIGWPNHDVQPLVAGISELAQQEPLGESWSCPDFIYGAATGRTCVGFVDTPAGGMRALPTLGGYDGFASGTNDRNQIVGWAETTYHDPTCEGASAGPGAQILGFLAVRYDPPYATPTVLQPLAGDSATAATAINDRGQAVGISGACDQAVGRYTAKHIVLWQNGGVTQILFAPQLGGAAWNTPESISNAGEVVGFANLRSNQTGNPAPQAFSWTQAGGMVDLGLLAPGDGVSFANGVNDEGEIVGFSGSRAFVKQGAHMVDLNTLVSGATPYYLTAANDVNDAGVIVGQACDAAAGGGCSANSPVFGFLAIPHGSCAFDARRMATRSVALPVTIRARMYRRYGIRIAG